MSEEEKAIVEQMAEIIELSIGRMFGSMRQLVNTASTTPDYLPIAQAAFDVVKSEIAKRDAELVQLRADAFWKEVYEDVPMTGEQVRNELRDYHFMLNQVSKVYMAITGGVLSKTNYYAEDVIAEYERQRSDELEELGQLRAKREELMAWLGKELALMVEYPPKDQWGHGVLHAYQNIKSKLTRTEQKEGV